MDSTQSYWTNRALLEWQVEMGATEAMLDTPVNRYELPDQVAKPAAKAAEHAASGVPDIPAAPKVDTVAEAMRMAHEAADIPALQAALAGFDHCALKQGARNLVFADGDPSARVMIITDPPEKDEDRAGLPFAGRNRALLDKMLAAIDMGFADAPTPVYATAVVPWRPAQDRPPDDGDREMLLPFLHRHITLANPDVLVLMGSVACHALLGESGITRLRGRWAEVLGRPALPMFHPAHLLRTPAAKREAWADLLALKAKLRG
ncbi:uracil-DNA glycosylase [Octadecabacter sp. SW4]|uniref:uracil-DNA glycosylase n=1 Tax=Octadecabacter sp. SW4 TaxID=2602067 RepID=UPI0011C1F40B|nr:uracil-DNA glycosylase [Octadecabacter sp. SW4]QEE36793.1 uracil-DNA glycosylase [Octadecabacter sp. SW4]